MLFKVLVIVFVFKVKTRNTERVEYFSGLEDLIFIQIKTFLDTTI
jgi:hypothetical protein